MKGNEFTLRGLFEDDIRVTGHSAERTHQPRDTPTKGHTNQGTQQRQQSEGQILSPRSSKYVLQDGVLCRVFWLPFVKRRMRCLTNGSLEFTCMLRLLLPSPRNQWQFNRKQDATQRISRNISLLPPKSHFYARTHRLKDSITWPYIGSSKHQTFTHFSKEGLDKNLFWSRKSL